MSLTDILWNKCRNRILKKTGATKQTAFVGGSLIFSVTTKCNFSCKHCLRDLKNTKDLPLEIAKKVIQGAKKYHFNHAVLTGGEPLLYPHFKEIIELLIQNNYRFGLTTNGYNFNLFADFFKKTRPNISFIGFSVESINKEEHDAIRHPGSFQKLLESFSLCREFKIPFRILTAASLRNYRDLFNIALFAKKKGASAFVVTTVLPCPRSVDNNLVLDAAKRNELFLTLREMPKIIKFPIIIAADIRTQSNISLCNAVNLKEITVDADGSFVQCCEVANFDDENIAHRAVITSLKDKTFDDALKLLSKHIHEFNCRRIDNYKTQPDVDDIDFSSCFYCLGQLGLR